MTDASSFVLTDVVDRIGWIWLNEPERLNPITLPRIAEIQAAAEELSARDDVSVIVVSGKGRAFSAGADLRAVDDFPAHSDPAAGSMSLAPEGSWTLVSVRQPVIALVNGPAIGYGFELALQADIRIAAASARFRAPFGLLGTISDTGAGSWLLPRIVGLSAAAELFFTSRMYSAEDALAIGLVNRVVADADALQAATDLALEIAAASPWALRAMKRMLHAALTQSADEHILLQYKIRNTQPSIADSPYLRQFANKTAPGAVNAEDR